MILSVIQVLRIPDITIRISGTSYKFIARAVVQSAYQIIDEGVPVKRSGLLFLAFCFFAVLKNDVTDYNVGP